MMCCMVISFQAGGWKWMSIVVQYASTGKFYLPAPAKGPCNQDAAPSSSPSSLPRRAAALAASTIAALTPPCSMLLSAA